MTPFADFFEELRRRNVYRATAWYAAAAFVVWQAADIALPALGFPPVAMTLLVVGAIAGLPLVVGLSWAYDLGRATDADGEGAGAGRRAVLMGVMATLVTFTGLALWVGPWRAEAEARADEPARMTQVTFTGTVGLLGQPPRLSPGGQLVAYRDVASMGLLVRDLTSEAPPIELASNYGDYAWSADGSELLVMGVEELHGRRFEGILAFPRLGGAPRIVMERDPERRGRLSNEAGRIVAGSEGRCLYRVAALAVDALAVVCEHLDGDGRSDTTRLVTPVGEVYPLAIAPDGRGVLAMVFDDGGAALHLLPAGAGSPRRLLDGQVFEAVWPAPERAYVRRGTADGNEFLALGLEDGGRRRIAVASGVRGFDMAADGGRLVYFRRESRTHVWSYEMTADGLAAGRAVTRGTAPSYDPAFAPGSRRIAFVQRGDVHIADTAGIERLTTLASARAAEPSWSPDGGRLAFLTWPDIGRAAGIGIVDVQSRRSTRLESPAEHAVVAMAWGREEELFLVEWDDGTSGELRVNLLNLGDRSIRRLMTDTLMDAPRIAVSPDRNVLGMAAHGWGESLVLLDREGRRSTVALEEFGWPVGWRGRDTVLLASLYTRTDQGFSSHLMTVNVSDGRLLRRLPRPECFDFSLSPDGTRVACIRQEAYEDLWAVDGF